MKKVFWKDALNAISHTFSRYLAIILLIMLGTFTYTGLKMTGPDMRQSATNFFNSHKLADSTVLSNYGLNTNIQNLLDHDNSIKEIEYGHFQDAKLEKSDLNLRIFSKPKKLSTYQLMDGHYPTRPNQIALDYLLRNKFHVKQKITINSSNSLKNKTYTVVGFIKSSEYLDKKQYGTTNIGNGQLNGYAVVAPEAFLPTNYQIARLTYKNTQNLSPFSLKYRNRIYDDKSQLENKLNVSSKLPLTVTTREDNYGYSAFRSNCEKVEVLAGIFPVFLFAVAALVSLTTMARFVDEQRIIIGTYKALGYNNFEISIKFLLYSTSAALIGIVIGSVLGYTYLPNMIIKAYTANITLDNVQLLFRWSPLFVAIIIALFSTTLIALLTLHNIFKERPAALLLPKPPKKGSRIFLEYIPFIWNKLNFTSKVAARNLFRYKGRMLMTILGIAGCTGLLVMGFGIKDSLSNLAYKQYQDIQKFSAIEINSPNQNENLQAHLKSLNVKNTPVNFMQFHKHIYQTGTTQNIIAITPQYPNQFKNYFDLKNRSSQKSITLPASGIIITEKLAMLLHKKVGDNITVVSQDNKSYTFKISDITEMYVGHYIFMNPTVYQNKLGHFKTNAHLLKVKSNKFDLVTNNLLKQPGVQAIISNQANKEVLNNFTGSLTEVIAILILIATILAIVVIYNLTNINVAERVRELSTIKVLGFYDSEATMYIYRETIILSILGIILGSFLGSWLHHFIITNLPPNDAMFDPKMTISNFILSALIPLLVTLAMAFVIHHKIKKINMLDALKSVD